MAGHQIRSRVQIPSARPGGDETGARTGNALGGLVRQEKVEHDSVELLRVLQVWQMGRVLDDCLAYIWNRIHQKISSLQDGRHVLVADNHERRRMDLVQAPYGQRVRVFCGSFLEVRAHGDAVHVEEQLSQRFRDVPARTFRAVQKEMHHRLVECLQVACLACGGCFREDVSMLWAKRESADG